jgi:hypothetical protein
MIATLFLFSRSSFVRDILGIGFVCSSLFVVYAPDPMLVSITVFVNPTYTGETVYLLCIFLPYFLLL